MPVQDLNKDSGSGKDVVKNIEQLVLEDGDADDDLVPVEIRPGHIRFTPSGKCTAADIFAFQKFLSIHK